MTIKKAPIEADERGLSFFIQREGENLPPTQVLRELVQNGFEADAATVWIDYVEEEGVETLFRRLLRVSDDGRGMDEEALRRHIKTIHYSGKELGRNHGIGARIASLAQSPAGVTWASRQDEGEAMVKVVKEDDVFVLEKWPVEDDRLLDVVAPDPGYLDLVPESGTAVILHGDGIADTWTTHTDVLSYLNSRYWDVPGTIKVKEPRWNWRQADGLDAFLSRNAEERGYVDLHLANTKEQFRLHWALLTEAAAIHNPRSGVRRGQIGAMLEGEMFRWSNASQRMVQFGITSRKVQERIVIVVELTHRDLDAKNGWVMNTGRDDIRRAEGRNEIEWAAIGRGFVQNMPAVLAKLVEDSEQGRSHEHLLRHRFGRRWQQLTRHMPRKRDGDSKRDRSSDEGEQGAKKGKGESARPRQRGPVVNPGDTREQKPPTGRRRRAKPRKGTLADGGGVKVNGVELPKPEWKSGDDFPGDEGRFAIYEDGAPTFYLNEDHPLVQNAIEYYGTEYSHLPEITIRMRVKEEFGVEMLGKLVHVNEFRDSEHWTKDDVQKMLSQEALTFAALGMQALDSQIVKTLKAVRG
jgi:Histidine kinase-, DNA gyrase B-, and HSP90-like ATPase